MEQQQQNVHPEIITNRPSQHSAMVILILSLLMPGLGHIMLGQQKKGVIILIQSMIFMFVVVVLCYVFVGIFLVPFWLVYFMFVLLDGVKLAERQERGLTLMEGECYYKMVKLGLTCHFQHCFETGSPQDPRLS